MDDERIKKLAITLVVAIAIIMLAKYMLTKTYSSLNKAAATKKPVIIYKQELQVPAPAVTTDSQPASAVKPITSDIPASAVNVTN